MIKIEFNLDTKNKISIEYGYFGSEKYYHNNKLILKHWSHSRSGLRELKTRIDGEDAKVKIDINCRSLTLKSTTAKAYLNEVLINDDILKDYKEEVKEGLKKDKKTVLKSLWEPY